MSEIEPDENYAEASLRTDFHVIRREASKHMFANIAGKGASLPAGSAEAVRPAGLVAPGRGCICIRTTRLSARTASNASSLHCTEKENKRALAVDAGTSPNASRSRPARERIPRLR